MKPIPIAGVILAMTVLGVGCSAPPKPAATEAARVTKAPRTPKDMFPSLESHLSGAWISGATRLQAHAAVIYYHGSAERDSIEDEPWTGTVTGDILYVSPSKAVLMPAGALTLGKTGTLKAVGPHRTFLALPGENPTWWSVLSM